MATTSSTTSADRRSRRRRLARRVGIAALVVALGAAWVWQRTLPLARVSVVDAHHAPVDEVVALTGATPGAVALFSLSPALLADRAQRHPWVKAASVRRLPTGTLRVKVVEREPVVLVLDGAGRPAHFLDAEGFAMPLDGAAPAVYDVPVLRGAPAYHPTQPVESGGLRSLLAALHAADAEALALVSEIDWSRTARIWTTPVEGHGSIPVRIGSRASDDHADQLRRLRAFWDQAVLPRPGTDVRLVDLRFDGQVVTREGDPPAPPDSPPAEPAPAPPAST